jgi:hypothetical protein
MQCLWLKCNIASRVPRNTLIAAEALHSPGVLAFDRWINPGRRHGDETRSDPRRTDLLHCPTMAGIAIEPTIGHSPHQSAQYGLMLVRRGYDARIALE